MAGWGDGRRGGGGGWGGLGPVVGCWERRGGRGGGGGGDLEAGGEGLIVQRGPVAVGGMLCSGDLVWESIGCNSISILAFELHS